MWGYYFYHLRLILTGLTLLNDKILDLFKLETFADNITKYDWKIAFCFDSGENIVGKAFSPFPTMFSIGFFLRVFETGGSVVKS